MIERSKTVPWQADASGLPSPPLFISNGQVGEKVPPIDRVSWQIDDDGGKKLAPFFAGPAHYLMARSVGGWPFQNIICRTLARLIGCVVGSLNEKNEENNNNHS